MTTQTNGTKPTDSTVKAQFQAMLAPTSKPVSRKAWGIDVSTIWLPYFTAAKTVGAVKDDELSDESLGAPFRLPRDNDTGEVKFSRSGRPMFSVAPQVNEMVNRARDNYIAGLLMQTRNVQEEMPDAYSGHVERQYKAGAPIIRKEQFDLDQAAAALLAAAASAPEPVAVAVATEPVADEPKKGKKAS